MRRDRLARRAVRRPLSTADRLSLQPDFGEYFDKTVNAMLARGRYGQVVKADTGQVHPADLALLLAEVVQQMAAVDSGKRS